MILPLLCCSAVMVGYLSGYWMPRSLANIEGGFQRSIERHLDSVTEGLVPLLLGHQLDAVVENLNSLMKKNQDWVDLLLLDAEGRQLYPLELLSSAKAIAPGRDLQTVERRIRYLDRDLGSIRLRVDFGPRLSELRKRHWELMSVMLGGILIFVITTWFILDRLVVRPVTLLSRASRGLAEDDFNVPLLKVSQDEVGGLVDEFGGMRTAIQEYRSNFQSARAELERELDERKRAEEALRKSEAFVRKILETVDEGFIVIDRNYRIVSANKAFCGLVKLPEGQVLGRYCYEVSHHTNEPCFEAGEDCPVKWAFETEEPHSVTHIHIDDGGGKSHVEIKSYPVMDASGKVVSVIETLTDITEKRKLEEQLHHSQKLEALGTLAGGVAHDFNNILTAIVGFNEIMKMQMSADDPKLRYTREILLASERAAQLTRSLLIFSRRQPAELKPLNINDLVTGMKKMMLRLIGEDIETNISLSDEALVVMGDYGQLEQVLMNFATNARDAMPDGGILSIKTEICEIDSEFAHMHGVDRPGEYALISISDTGKGMDEKTRERIFEPFFTTKGTGKGTGLGLAIVFGIVKQHNGYINCYSEPDRGTVFKVYLPLIREEVFRAEEEAPLTVKGGSETILIADDDQNIRRLVKELLEKYGYTVIEAKDGEDAVKIFLTSTVPIDLALFDVIMPRKSGKEAFEEIRAAHPRVKVLFFSGYTEDIIQRKRIIEEELPLLHKPVKPQELLAKIRECLDVT